MRFSDIKVGYIYNVIFDPVRDCEFDGKHLAVVLKKNNDKTSFIVMPLTSAPNGVGVNKMDVGEMDCLPTSLKNNHTYAVYNQIRTVNANRFITLKEGGSVKECRMEKTLYYKLVVLGLQEIVYNIPQDEKITLLKKTYEAEVVSKAKDLAYKILSIKKAKDYEEDQVQALELQIKDIIKDIPYSLNEQLVQDGIGEIFENAKKI